MAALGGPETTAQAAELRSQTQEAAPQHSSNSCYSQGLKARDLDSPRSLRDLGPETPSPLSAPRCTLGSVVQLPIVRVQADLRREQGLQLPEISGV